MIPCQACGNQNPIGTRYCRRCGEKVHADQQQVMQAVQSTNDDLASRKWLERGRSALVIGAFLLVCALVLRYAVVPPMPSAEVPPVDAGPFIPAELPKVEAKAEAAAPAVKPALAR
ncbi:MAG: hypothetical protein J0M02_11930 [Planctomycetes bacterium]|nr:hypothetical protein [Planctomycetota bacterium]